MEQENNLTPDRQHDPNDMPPLKRAIPLGLQHVLVMDRILPREKSSGIYSGGISKPQ